MKDYLMRNAKEKLKVCHKVTTRNELFNNIVIDEKLTG
jgi:hypothetical protein